MVLGKTKRKGDGGYDSNFISLQCRNEYEFISKKNARSGNAATY